jgi:hypothetical protein
MAWTEIGLPKVLGAGTYRLTFEYPALVAGLPFVPPPAIPPATKTLMGYIVDFSDYAIDYTSHRLSFVAVVTKETKTPDVQEAGLPVEYIVKGAIALLVILGIYLTLQKIETLVEGPAGVSVVATAQTGLVLLIVGVIAYVVFRFKK